MNAQVRRIEAPAPVHAHPSGIWGCTFTSRGVTVSAPSPAIPMPRHDLPPLPVPSNACWRLPLATGRSGLPRG
jgi:hypothetical protein